MNALAKEGGLESTFWAGPEKITQAMRSGRVAVEGGPRQKRSRLRLGFCGDHFAYAISLGLPQPSSSAFALDPEIKRECIWSGQRYRPSSMLVDRDVAIVKTRVGRSWEVIGQHLNSYDSIFSSFADPDRTPEILALRDNIRNWRFYDHFRTDVDAPARQPQMGTRTPVLHRDGRDLAAALQTIKEVGDQSALDQAVSDAFPGAALQVVVRADGCFALEFSQHGLLRPLSGQELSDGTLRYLLWIAALLTPRPPPLMVLNEPETSLHPDLLPALARLIKRASRQTQIWVVSHASRLVASLESDDDCHSIALKKELGQTMVRDQGVLDAPAWSWPDKGI